MGMLNSVCKRSISKDSEVQSCYTATSSVYDRNFQQNMIDNDIRLGIKTNRPQNEEYCKSRLEKRRASLSSDFFTRDDHKSLLTALRESNGNRRALCKLFPPMVGTADYPSTTKQSCENWAPIVDENLVTPKLGFLDGVKPTFVNSSIRRNLNTFIVPSTAGRAPFLPNFFMEVQGDDISPGVAHLKIRYNGAYCARGMFRVQMYGRDDEKYDNNAYVFSAGYAGGSLQLYTHHVSQPGGSGTSPHYYMTLIRAWEIRYSVPQARAALTAIRNARDLAYEFRKQFLKDAKSRTRQS